MQAANWASQLGEPFVAIRHWLYWARQAAVHAPDCASVTLGVTGAAPDTATPKRASVMSLAKTTSNSRPKERVRLRHSAPETSALDGRITVRPMNAM
jgi:hypothetical protein